MGVTRLGYCLDDDYPTIDWSRHGAMADLWLEIDRRHKASCPIDDLLAQVAYDLHMPRHWPRVDCLAMSPGLAVSDRARVELEALGVPGMRFLEFRVNDEPYFCFYTERRLDCLDRERSEIRYFRASPNRVKQVVRYAFVQERAQPRDVFTVPERSDGMFFWSQETFITDDARTALESAGLIGVRFEPLPEPAR